MYEHMNDKVAIVTGGGSGIGRETARMFAREGVKVVVADWSEEGGQETVSIIESAGGQASYCNVDVSNEAMVKAMVNIGDYLPGSPINSNRLTKLTSTLTFSNDKARQLGWNPNPALDQLFCN